MPAGSVTDDTKQAVLLGRLLVQGRGGVDPGQVARALLAWERRMRDAGSLDLLGPSTRRAVTAIEAGVSPEESGRTGDTNGAAMRIAPVGIAVGAGDLGALVERVVEASKATHNTGVALAGACAVAAAVSAAVAGQAWPEVIDTAVRAARLGAHRGAWVAGAAVADRIRWAVELADQVAGHDALATSAALERIVRLVGTSVATQESVPAAFGIVALYPRSPWDACRAAASVGGDCDTIGAIAGAIAGAGHGRSAWPVDAIATVATVNGLDLDALATDLLRLRAGGAA